MLDTPDLHRGTGSAVKLSSGRAGYQTNLSENSRKQFLDFVTPRSQHPRLHKEYFLATICWRIAVLDIAGSGLVERT